MSDQQVVSLLSEIRDLLAADEAKRDRYLEQIRRLNEDYFRTTRRNALIGNALAAFFVALGVIIGVRIGLAVTLPIR